MKQPMHIDNNAAGLPAESWWTQLPREGATQRAAQEVPRMSASKFGRIDSTLTVGPNEEAAGTKLNRAKRNQGGYVTLGMHI